MRFALLPMLVTSAKLVAAPVDLLTNQINSIYLNETVSLTDEAVFGLYDSEQIDLVEADILSLQIDAETNPFCKSDDDDDKNDEVQAEGDHDGRAHACRLPTQSARLQPDSGRGAGHVQPTASDDRNTADVSGARDRRQASTAHQQ